MDLNIVISAFIFFIPAIVGVLFAKRYNFLHGLITYLAFIVIIFGVVELMAFIATNVSSFSSFATQASTYAIYNEEMSFAVIKNLFNTLSLSIAVSTPWVYIIFIGLFVVSHLFSSSARKRRIARERY